MPMTSSSVSYGRPTGLRSSSPGSRFALSATVSACVPQVICGASAASVWKQSALRRARGCRAPQIVVAVARRRMARCVALTRFFCMAAMTLLVILRHLVDLREAPPSKPSVSRRNHAQRRNTTTGDPLCHVLLLQIPQYLLRDPVEHLRIRDNEPAVLAAEDEQRVTSAGYRKSRASLNPRSGAFADPRRCRLQPLWPAGMLPRACASPRKKSYFSHKCDGRQYNTNFSHCKRGFDGKSF